MKNQAQRIFSAGFAILSFFLGRSAIGQGAVPLTLPLFQNDNASCQDQDAIFESYTATCGAFTGESPDFPDCVALSEPRPQSSDGFDDLFLLNYFPNQNLHDAASCGNQFGAGVTTVLTYPTADSQTRFQGSVVNADFSGTPFSDVLYPVTTDTSSFGSVIEELQSEAGGGFSTAADLNVLPSLEIGLAIAAEDPLDNFTTFRTDFWPRNNFFLFNGVCQPVVGGSNVVSCAADKSLAAVDCNGDGAPDSVTAIAMGNPSVAAPSLVNLRVHVNGGGGLAVPPLDVPVFNVPDPDSIDDDFVAAAVAIGDFGGAGGDVVVAIHSSVAPGDQVAVCQNDGACGYACLTPQTLSALIGEDSPRPYSVAAGDFNGDGADDAAISLAGQSDADGSLLSSLLYLSGDGSGGLGGPLLVSSVRDGSGNALLNVAGADFIDMVPTSLSTGQFDNDGILDVAVTNFHGPVADTSTLGIGGLTPFSEPRPQGDVVVFTSNGTSGGGFAPLPTALHFPTEPLNDFQDNPLGTFSAGRASGLASADFDRCGGDDLIGLAELCVPGSIASGTGGSSGFIDPATGNCVGLIQRIASVFLNANEAPLADAGPDLSGDIDAPLAVAATCLDPSDDDRTFTWTVTASPPGSTAQFSPATGNLAAPDLSSATSFQADLAGTYTLELTCADFCALEASDTLTVTLGAQNNTQGGCLASLTPSVTASWSGLLWMLAMIPLLYLRLRNGA